jgi:hypothetical protein
VAPFKHCARLESTLAYIFRASMRKKKKFYNIDFTRFKVFNREVGTYN